MVHNSKLMTHLLELKATGNKLRTICGLQYLTNIEILDVSSNKIRDLNSFSNVISKLQNLKKLNIKDNPILKNAAFLSKTVTATQKLEYLNEVPITYQTRIYCKNMYMPSKDKPMNPEKEHLINAANKSSSNFPVSLRPRINEKLLSEIKKKWKPPKRP
ncbi:uncharacterized protein [Halyomorpha halys]|uniref:uncharacterized protein n=1 Tax=Halyomorpha halys TaxID=286706 RepID=UPI0006D4EF85|nr:uncharacterized protein LOC106690516 isoform X2 [Halyomorpha halys]